MQAQGLRDVCNDWHSLCLHVRNKHATHWISGLQELGQAGLCSTSSGSPFIRNVRIAYNLAGLPTTTIKDAGTNQKGMVGGSVSTYAGVSGWEVVILCGRASCHSLPGLHSRHPSHQPRSHPQDAQAWRAQSGCLHSPLFHRHICVYVCPSHVGLACNTC